MHPWVAFIIPVFVHQWHITSLCLEFFPPLAEGRLSEKPPWLFLPSLSETMRQHLQKEEGGGGRKAQCHLPLMSATRVVSQLFSCPLDFRHQNLTPSGLHTLKLSRWCHGCPPHWPEEVSTPGGEWGGGRESSGIYHTVFSKNILLTEPFLSHMYNPS